ncbi:hypothetical protein [Virgibacillus pantothenticus]|nr:hypothetical protein [Virgibacillus pantothenticus]MED3738811.1 hypothetical protein [Virgibacillus pantothenticus]QTY16920.1 hypothetical protein KBP50_03080 [Virgibacillus pantothenticus]
MMKVEELKLELKIIAEKYKYADELDKPFLEKERKKLGEQLKAIAGIEFNEHLKRIMNKRHYMTYTDVYWLFLMGMPASFILRQIGIRARDAMRIDFTNAVEFYRTQFEVREKKR